MSVCAVSACVLHRCAYSHFLGVISVPEVINLPHRIHPYSFSVSVQNCSRVRRNLSRRGANMFSKSALMAGSCLHQIGKMHHRYTYTGCTRSPLQSQPSTRFPVPHDTGGDATSGGYWPRLPLVKKGVIRLRSLARKEVLEPFGIT